MRWAASRISILYILGAVIWSVYAVACGISYGRPLDLVGWTQTPRVAAGEKLVVGYTVTRRQICEVTRYVTIIDGGGHRHEFPAEYRPALGIAGETESFFVERLVPASALPGLARYRVVLAYECPIQVGPILVPNLFHQAAPNTLILPDVEFEILAASPEDATHDAG